MKNATATNHGTKRRLEALRVAGGVPEDGSTTMIGSDEFT
jgi:hypothetical protein